MKRFKLDELTFRAISTLLETYVIYLVYLILTHWFELSEVNSSYFIIAALMGLFINIVDSDKMTQVFKARLVVIVGLFTSLILSIIANYGFNIINILVTAIVFLLVWNRAVKSYYVDFIYIYSMEQFKFHMLIIILTNVLVFMSSSMQYLIPLVTRYSVSCVVLAILGFFGIKNKKYTVKENLQKKSIIDMIFMAIFIIFTFILATPKILGIVMSILKKVFDIAYIIVLEVVKIIAYPIGYLIEILEKKLGPLIERGFEALAKTFGKYGENLDKVKVEDNGSGGSIPEIFYRIVSIIVLVIIAIIIMYIIYDYVNKLIKKNIKCDYVEEKEYIIKFKTPKISSILADVKNKITNAYNRAVFNLTADNKEKLRHEYKLFLKNIYKKRIIMDENCTPQEIEGAILQGYMEIDENIKYITEMYEQVRYGVKYPQNDELKIFKVSISKVLRVIV